MVHGNKIAVEGKAWDTMNASLLTMNAGKSNGDVYEKLLVLVCSRWRESTRISRWPVTADQITSLISVENCNFFVLAM